MADFTNVLKELILSMKQAFTEVNPFEDGTDFENFVSLKYNEISEDVLAKANLNTPLNIFKFMLIKIIPIMGSIEAPGHFKKMLVTLREVKAKYMQFESKKIPMSPRELKYVKSAYAALELGEMAIVASKEALENKDTFGINFNCSSAFDNGTKINIEKLKQICSDILDANNPIGEGLVGFLSLVRIQMSLDRRSEVIRFAYCVMEEGMKRVRKVRTEQGLILENPWMKDLMRDTEMLVCHLKLQYLTQTFSISSTLRDIGPASYLETLKNEEDGKTLMDIFKNYAGQDEMCQISLKIESLDQAKEVYKLMLKLSTQIKFSENLKLDADKKLFEGLAQCYLAVYHTDSEEIYRLSVSSLHLLESVRKQRQDEMSKMSDENGSLLIAVEVNLRRIWNIKYDFYQQNKTQENHAELKKSASNRLELGNTLTQRIINVNSTYFGWWIYLDTAKCTFLVYNDQICARKMLQLTHMELMKDPEQIQIFNNNFEGIDLDRNMNADAFVRVMFKKFNPNVEIKEKNPFEDGTSFTDFACYSYSSLSENILANTKLSSALNIYKFLAIKAVIAYNNESKESKMKIFKECKKAYKDFMNQEISMTVEERKYVQSAYDTIRLAEMYSEHFDCGIQELTLEGFDFQKLKSVCSGILEGPVQEISLFIFMMMFSILWCLGKPQSARFLVCVMNEVKKKTRSARKENDVILNNCTCVLFAIREAEMRANFVNLYYLDIVFSFSSYAYTLSPVCTIGRNLSKDKETGEMLMKLFENYEGDEEFQEVPEKAENYDQAKMMFELILKLTNERKSTEKPQHIYDSYYYEGAAYSHLAAFIPDSSEVYKLCEKSTELLKKYLNFDKIKYKVEQTGKIDRIIGAMDRNYAQMKNIKYEVYKKNKSMENREALMEVTSERIKWGNKFLTDFDKTDWLFSKFWTRLDLIKCHLQVKEDETAAKKCAKDLYKELMDESTDMKLFYAISGIEFDRNMKKEIFVKLVIEKLKKTVIL